MKNGNQSNRKGRIGHVAYGLMWACPVLATSFAFFALMVASMLATITPPSSTAHLFVVLSAAWAAIWLSLRILNALGKNGQTGPSITTVLVQCLLAFLFSLHVPITVFIIAQIGTRNAWNPVWGCPMAVLISIYVPGLLWKWLTDDPYRTEILRGTRLITLSKARQRAAAARRPGQVLLDWCGVRIPDRFSVGHFLLVGAPGSGKTVSLRLLMQSILPRISPGADWRAVIYDAKQDILPILSGMKLACPVVTLNALDQRGAAWDMAKDIDSHAVALQVAANLIPEEQGHNAFFVKAARDLLAAVMIALHLARPGSWTLADVVLTLSDKERAKQLLLQHRETRHIARDYFARHPRTLADIQQTITAHISMLRPVAAAWAHATHRISLHQWAQGEFILVLANDETLRGPLDALNAAILQRLTQIALAQSECRRRRTWFFLDELKEAGKIDCLARLMTKGRSKGVRCLIAFQTIEGLRSVYGQDVADDIVGLCTTKSILRTDSIVTAKWAAEILGEAERREWRQTRQSGTNGPSTAMAEQIVKRETMLACELMQLPLANDRCFVGYFVTPGIGVYHGAVHFGQRLSPLGEVPSFVPRPPEHQYIYDEEEEDRVVDTDNQNDASLDELGSLWEDEDGSANGTSADRQSLGRVDF